MQWIGVSFIIVQLKTIFKDVDDDIQNILEGKVDQELLKVLLLFKTEMEHVKNDVQDVLKIATGQKGEELDREKYKMLVSEYRKFKTKNVKHFKFSSAANLSMFGKDEFVQWSRTM